MARRDKESEQGPSPAAATKFANQAEVSERDRVLLPSETGREEGLAEDEALSDFEAEVAAHPVGGRPMSEITGRHDTGNETIDGLDSLEESLRRAAEDIPVGGRRERG